LIAQLILNVQAGLDLGEHRGDHRERIELVLVPFPVAEFHKPERSGGDVTGQQRDRRQGDGRNAACPEIVRW
jgi:hypothetical protein